MWKSSVGGLGEHEMGVMRTKGRARFVTHLEDRDSVNEEFLAREFGNFLEERMGVRLEDGVGCGGDGHGNEMHTDAGFLKSLGSAAMKIKNAIAPSDSVKAKNAFIEAGKKKLHAEAAEQAALKKLEGNIKEVEEHRKAVEEAKKRQGEAFKPIAHKE
jgi:hypothetical protein